MVERSPMELPPQSQTWNDVVPPVLGAEHGEGDGVLDEDGVPVRPVHDGALQPGLHLAPPLRQMGPPLHQRHGGEGTAWGIKASYPSAAAGRCSASTGGVTADPCPTAARHAGSAAADGAPSPVSAAPGHAAAGHCTGGFWGGRGRGFWPSYFLSKLKTDP